MNDSMTHSLRRHLLPPTYWLFSFKVSFFSTFHICILKKYLKQSHNLIQYSCKFSTCVRWIRELCISDWFQTNPALSISSK